MDDFSHLNVVRGRGGLLDLVEPVLAVFLDIHDVEADDEELLLVHHLTPSVLLRKLDYHLFVVLKKKETVNRESGRGKHFEPWGRRI